MIEVGDRIVVRTPDRRAYFGRLIELRKSAGNDQVVVRLDSGWVTSYPLALVHPVDEDASSPDRPATGP